MSSNSRPATSAPPVMQIGRCARPRIPRSIAAPIVAAGSPASITPTQATPGPNRPNSGPIPPAAVSMVYGNPGPPSAQ
jgi:hypothetical protein